MPTATSEVLDTALGRLDSADRALLELSLRQGVKDPELAELMRIDLEQVRHRREVALDDLGDDLGIEERERLMGALLDHWRSPGKRPSAEEPEPGPEDVEDGDRPSRRATVIAIVVVALLGIGTGTLVALLTGDDEQEAAAPEAGPLVAMEPSAAARGGTGTARFSGGRLVMRLRGLPRGNYQVWVYDSPRRARPVATFRHDTTRVDVPLTVDPTPYRFLDVSREPADGDQGHSGTSVLRAPIARMLES